jgi:hypothetical protein
MCHLEVAGVGQAIEMVPSHVGVDRKEFGNLRAGQGFRTLANREIDAPAGGVTQRRGEIADAAVKGFQA